MTQGNRIALSLVVALAWHVAQQRGCSAPRLLPVEPPIARDGLAVLIVADPTDRDPAVVNSMLWRELVPPGAVRVVAPDEELEDAAFASAAAAVTPPAVVVSNRPGGGETRSLEGLTAEGLAELVRKWKGA